MKVFCGKCQYFGTNGAMDYNPAQSEDLGERCYHPNNWVDNYKWSRGRMLDYPHNLNNGNKCPWFKEKKRFEYTFEYTYEKV